MLWCIEKEGISDEVFKNIISTLNRNLLISDISCRPDQYDFEELPVLGELVNHLHMSKVPYRKRREEGITGPLKVVLCYPQ